MSSHSTVEGVLIVDGDPAIRDLVQSLLEREGYSTLVAGSAKEARAVFSGHENRIALLIADMDIPGTDGLELARQLRRFKTHLQVLCMAASSEVDQPPEGVTILPKPYTIRELSGRVRDALLARKRDVATRVIRKRELKSG